MARVRIWSWAALAGLAVPLALATVPASAATAAKPYDFDGDGRPDLVVGAPGLEVGGHRSAGGVLVLPPTSKLVPKKFAVITQSTSGVDGASENGDAFGSAVASADFDRDGYADLAVGLPSEDLSGLLDAGAVTVLHGSSKGLTGKRSKQISAPLGKSRIARFGTSLAAGDLDGDGYPDLVVGAPGDRAGSLEYGSGTVTVLPGGRKGLRTDDAVRIGGRRAETHYDDFFGAVVRLGNVDGRPGLDVVATSETSDGPGQVGGVSVCSGGSTLPTACDLLVTSTELHGATALVVGDVAGGDRPEIVVGAPLDEIDDEPGHLEVLRLDGTGPGTEADGQRFEQHGLGLPGATKPGDRFGASLAVGQLTGDGHDDLVVGAPGETVGTATSGRVFLVPGGDVLAPNGGEAWDQSSPGVPGSSETGDAFGGSVGLQDRDGDGRLDLTVGAPGEDDGSGRLTTLPGDRSGFSPSRSKSFGLSTYGYRSRAGADLGDAIGG